MMPRHSASQDDILHPRRIVENLSFCPGSVSTYAAQHMDSISKILNHLLVLVCMLDIMLFFASFSVGFLPTLGFETFIISLLLATQAILVWLILNNHRVSVASCLAPTEFKIGLAFGITIGAVILSFLVVHDFHDTNHLCNPYADKAAGNRYLMGTSSSLPNHRSFLGATDAVSANTTTDDDMSSTPKTYVSPEQQQQVGYLPQDFLLLCDQRRGSMVAVWFWSGLSFWCNFVICLLLWIGHSELSNSTQYENLSMEDYENHFAAQRNNHSGGGGGGAFVGDYTTVPAVRPDSHLSSRTNNTTSASSIPTGYGPSAGGYSDQPQVTSV